MTTFRHPWSRAGAVVAVTTVLVSTAAAQNTVEVLYSFSGNPDAEYPSTDLVIDGDGNLYGMTVLGGDFGSGTVFRLSPSAGGWIETVLYSFTSAADGGQPYGGVTLDEQGNLYGTAVVGGTGGACPDGGCGVVWKLTNTGTQSVIHNFTAGDDGYGPGGPVVFDSLGNLYGMTPTGGANGLGVVYRLSPDANGDWTLMVIHAFTGGDDGGTGSAGRLLFDDAGNILGVATVGGAHGAGTVFQLIPSERGPWTLTTLYAFEGDQYGGFPYGGLVRDASGNLYGTTYYGGAYGLGAAFKLAPGEGGDGGWHASVLHSFRDGLDGSYPISHLVLDAAGNLWGTTSEGGAAGCDCGTIFRLSQSINGSWKERVVHRFENDPDGAFAYNGLVADSAGNLYGTTVYGGDDGEGVIFKYTP